MAEKIINTTDLKGIEDIAKIQEYVNAPEHEPAFWRSLCDTANWEKGYAKLNYRELDISDLNVSEAEAKEMKEAVAPDPSKVTYKSYEVTTKDYGLRFPYTEKALRTNYDDLKRDIGRTLRYQAIEVTENLIGSQFIKSRYTVTLGTGDSKFATLFKKARAILKKNKCRLDGLVAIMTPEALEALELEMEAKGVVMPDGVKSELIKDGLIKKYTGFEVVERADDFLYDDTNQYIIFIAKENRLGIKPVKTFGNEQWEVIDNPLGSGVVADASGNVVADYNHQAGAVAANLKNFAAIHQADESHLVCKAAIATDSAVDGGTTLTPLVATKSSPNA